MSSRLIQRSPIYSAKDFIRDNLGSFFSEIDLRRPPNETWGDYAIRVPKSEEEVERQAQLLSRTLNDKKIKVSAKGCYLNFSLSNDLLAKIVENMVLLPNESVASKTSSKVMVEYSSPNTNKPLHLGHARNGVLGLSLANLLRYTGDTVYTANLVNDRGIHICKSMTAYEAFGEGKNPQTVGIKGDHFVGEYYVLFEKECQNEALQILGSKGLSKDELPDEIWKKYLEEARAETKMMLRAREMLRLWEKGDTKILSLWKKMNAWVISGFKETYQRFGAKFDVYYFESETYLYGKDVILEGLKSGKFLRRADSAVYVDLSAYGFGKKVLLRPDGTSIYVTQDLGTTIKKVRDYDLDRNIFVVAVEQIYHFQVLFKVLELLGYGWAKNCLHYSYELVELPTGRMKSREGITVDLDDLLDELRDRVLIIMEKRIKDDVLMKAPSKSALKKNAEIIGQAALKYFLLSTRPNSRIKFDIEKSLSFEGKTGPYILYQFVRAGKIIEKNKDIDWNTQNPDFTSLEGIQVVHNLLISLVQFSDVMREARDTIDQSKIADYLFEVAASFSAFYNCLNIRREPDQKKRVALLYLVSFMQKLVKEALDVLGIETVDEM